MTTLTSLSESDVHHWVDAAHEQWARGLEFRELRRGAQAVSDLYVHKRKAGGLSDKAANGRGKRAAFVVYFGGLHLLLVQAWMAEVEPPSLDTVWDFGCGPGIVGAAAARWAGGARLTATDRVGAHLEVAAWTARQLGVKARTMKVGLPEAVARVSRPSLLTFGWVLNELTDADRDATVDALASKLQKGCSALIFAPLSLRASPWWPDVARRLRRATSADLHEAEFRFQPNRPQCIADLDRATRLNHHTLGARVLFVPTAASARA
jgi:hypothetical protein